MEFRSTRTTLTFRRAFALPNEDRQVPAGDYVLVVEEQIMEGLTFNAYLRIGSYLIVNGGPKRPGLTEMIPITEDALAFLLACDAAPAARADVGALLALPDRR